MKRLTAIVAGVAMVALVPLSHLVLAKKPDSTPPAKVLICHISDVEARGVVDDNGDPVLDDDGNPVTEDVFIGEVISVASPAQNVHCAHGDHTSGLGDDPQVGDACERVVGSAATCGDADAVDPKWYPLGDDDDAEEE